jgi:hypothetical protein
MKNKNILIAGGVALGLGLIYFFWKKSKKDDETEKDAEIVDEGDDVQIVDEGDDVQETDTSLITAPDSIEARPPRTPRPPRTLRPLPSPAPSTSPNPKKFMIGRMNIAKTYPFIPINLVWFYLQNRPAQLDSNADYFIQGGRVKLNNAGVLTGEYLIQSRWIDGNGKIGAISLNIPKKKFVPVKDDRTLQDIAYFTPVSSSSFDGSTQFECDDVLTDI